MIDDVLWPNLTNITMKSGFGTVTLFYLSFEFSLNLKARSFGFVTVWKYIFCD